jgi:DNA-binding SARP family transcriptional activator
MSEEPGRYTIAETSVSKSQSQLELHLLGPPRVELEGLPLEIKRRKALALLIYLAVNGDRQRRDSLATMLWPESSQQSARKALRRDLSELNLALGGNWLNTDRESVGLRAGFGLDVAQFQQYLVDETVDLQTLIAAADLYQDDFLTGFTLPDCPEFDEWQFFQGESLRQALASVLERLAVILSDQADYETAIPYARRWLALDPLHEPAQRQLMQLYAQAGQQAAALRQYDLCRQTLEDELGISPTPETTVLYEQIRDRKVGPAEPAAMPGPTEERSAQAVAGELRAVTVLSVRVSGAIDAEAVMELANRLLMITEEVLSRYEAQIDRLLGEEMLAVFGAPQAHEDDRERALWAALEIQSEAQKQGLRARIGINTGDVYVGRTGPERYQVGTVIGPVVNLASRLGDASEPGEIIVGPDTYRLTAPLFDFQVADPIKMGDIAEPLSVYRLLGAKTGHGKMRGIVGLESPLVGRETEFGALLEALQRLQAGPGGIVTLVGEAGVGKSRLVAELQRQSLVKTPDGPQVPTSSRRGSSVQWVEGRCLSFGASIAYLLWLDVLWGLLGVTGEDPPLAVRDALRERVEMLCADCVDDVFPFLARLMSLPLAEEVEAVLRGLGNKGLKVGTFRAAGILIERAARQQGPLVVVCEDLHWADPTSLELLEQLLPLTDRAPVLFICLFRPETEHGCWHIKETAARQYRHRHTDLWLETLSDVESTRLLNNLLQLEELPPGLVERILDRAEGNPFYVEEIIRSLIDNEDIVWDEVTGRLQVRGTVPELAIPDTVRGVLMARIDRLQGGPKRVLQLASVIGRVFSYRVLEAIVQKERELSSHLSTLQREEMIRERTRIPELVYIFKHQLTQEAAYRTLLKKERRVFHRRVAEVLERLYLERIEEQVELLAHHWEQAEEPEKATEYLVRAGKKAAGRYANTEALTYFQRALVLADGQDGYDDILAHRSQVLLDMFLGREAAGDYKLLLDRARQSGNRSGELEALLGLASAYYTIALDEPDFASESLKLYEQAYTLAGRLYDKAGRVRALASTIWFTDFWTEYGNQAVANMEEARAISQEVEDEDLIIDCMMAREARGLLTIGQAEELLRRLEARHDLPRLKEAYFPLVWWYLDSGNFEKCVEYCDIM